MDRYIHWIDTFAGTTFRDIDINYLDNALQERFYDCIRGSKYSLDIKALVNLACGYKLVTCNSIEGNLNVASCYIFTIWAIPLPLHVDFIFTAFKMQMMNLFLRLFISIIMKGSLCIYCMLTVCVCQSWIKLPQIKSTQCNNVIWHAYKIELLYLKSFWFCSCFCRFSCV